MLELITPLTRFLEAATAAAKWRAVRPQERKLQRAMRRAFTEQGDLFLKGFASLRGKFQESITTADWISIFDVAAQETFTMFLDPIAATASAMLIQGAAAVIADLDLDVTFSLRNPRAVQYLQQHGAANVANINDTDAQLFTDCDHAGSQ